MGMIYCPECGKEISDKAASCPNCGCPIEAVSTGMSNTYNATGNSTYQSNNPYQTQQSSPQVRPYMPKQKNSGLGIAALVLSILGCTFWLGLILAIVDLCRKDGKKKTCSIIAVCVAVLWIIIAVAVPATNEENNINTEIKEVSSETELQQEKEIKENEELEQDENIQPEEVDSELTVGSSFEKKGLKITVDAADLDYHDYSDEFGLYEPADGMKYIMVSFTFENGGDTDAYVSIYDFDCYADNSSCEQVYLPDDSNFMNTNLSSGRNISFQTYYSVPIDAATIELEYETSYWTGEKAIIKLQ